MTLNPPNSFRLGPDEHGRYGIFGGRFVAETLMPLILELEAAYERPRPTRPFARSSTRSSSIMSAGPRRSISPSG
jgi:tryptophan synthase beta subunit